MLDVMILMIVTKTWLDFTALKMHFYNNVVS